MDIASVFEWFAQESISIAEQAAEPEQRKKLAELALLWASAAQRRSAGIILLRVVMRCSLCNRREHNTLSHRRLGAWPLSVIL